MCLCAALYIHIHVPDFICHMNEIQPTELDIIRTISVVLYQVPLQDRVEYKPEVLNASVSSQRQWQHTDLGLNNKNWLSESAVFTVSSRDNLEASTHLYTEDAVLAAGLGFGGFSPWRIDTEISGWRLKRWPSPGLLDQSHNLLSNTGLQ